PRVRLTTAAWLDEYLASVRAGNDGRGVSREQHSGEGPMGRLAKAQETIGDAHEVLEQAHPKPEDAGDTADQRREHGRKGLWQTRSNVVGRISAPSVARARSACTG